METPLEEARSTDLEEEKEEREIGLNLGREAACLRGLEREMEGEKAKAELCILGNGREMEIRIAGGGGGGGGESEEGK